MAAYAQGHCVCAAPTAGRSKSQAQFQSMEVRNSAFAAFIDVFTTNTYIMAVLSDSTLRTSRHAGARWPAGRRLAVCDAHRGRRGTGDVAPAATLMNIRNARKHFEALELPSA